MSGTTDTTGTGIRACPACAVEAPDDARWCGRCGAALPAPAVGSSPPRAAGRGRPDPAPALPTPVPDAADAADAAAASAPRHEDAPERHPRRRWIRAGALGLAVAAVVAVVTRPVPAPAPWPDLPFTEGTPTAPAVAHAGGVTVLAEPDQGVTLVAGPDGTTTTLPPVAGAPNVTADGTVEVLADGALVRLSPDGRVLDRVPLTGPGGAAVDLPRAGAVGLVPVAPSGLLAGVVGDRLVVLERDGQVRWGCPVPVGSTLHPVAVGSTPIALGPDGEVVGCTPGLVVTWEDVTGAVEVLWSGVPDEGPRLLTLVDGEARLYAPAPLALLGAVVDPPGPEAFTLAAWEPVGPGPAETLLPLRGTADDAWVALDADVLLRDRTTEPFPDLRVDTAASRTLLSDPRDLGRDATAIVSGIVVLRTGGDVVGLSVPEPEDPTDPGTVETRVEWAAGGLALPTFERLVALDADRVAIVTTELVRVVDARDGRVRAEVPRPRPGLP
ncbi:MAG: hypothetical protein ACLGIR_03645 [Actinomycetes bacterium]